MEGFTYEQHHPSLLDSLYYPNSPIAMPLLPPQPAGEITNPPSCFPLPTTTHPLPPRTSRQLMSRPTRAAAPQCLLSPHHGGEVPTPQASVEKKRKNWNGASSSSVQSKDPKGSKTRKQKKPSDGLKKKSMKACEEPPEGYIHVRARRGQATDSHSLAERVRRERISERMKMLQGLVPGCEKVTGKALVLDEIINYVQSLQNQVEFLSMRLASLNPVVYEMCDEFDDVMNQQETVAIQTGHMPSLATAGHPMMDTSPSLPVHGQGPTTFSQVHPIPRNPPEQSINTRKPIPQTLSYNLLQDNDGFLVQVGGSRLGLLGQVEFNNMCSFL